MAKQIWTAIKYGVGIAIAVALVHGFVSSMNIGAVLEIIAWGTGAYITWVIWMTLWRTKPWQWIKHIILRRSPELTKILYRKESVDLPYAEVNTVIVMLQGDEIPVDYRVLKDGARWRIYDILTEGVSLVNNYRSQFAGILQKSSYPELVRRLKSTIRQQEKG